VIVLLKDFMCGGRDAEADKMSSDLRQGPLFEGSWDLGVMYQQANQRLPRYLSFDQVIEYRCSFCHQWRGITGSAAISERTMRSNRE
jgi:hypothetical protein